MKSVLESVGCNAEALFQSLISVCNDYFYIFDLESEQFWASPNLTAEFGISAESKGLFADTWKERIHVRDRKRVVKAFQAFLAEQNTELALEYQILTGRGAYIWVSVKSRVYQAPGAGGRPFIVGAMRNLEQYEGVDSVTGLLKYSFCKQKFQEIFDSRQDLHCEILLLGMDEFNTINTLNNHNFGDAVLRETAQGIQRMLPDTANIYRYEGDQFLICAEKMTRRAIRALYERIRRYADQTHQVQGQFYRFTISGGIISYPKDGGTWSDLEKGASIALKTAKKRGKNQCVQFRLAMLDEWVVEKNLNHCMRDSVEHGFAGFRLVYQPVCHVDTLNIHGAEALLRYTMPDGTQISPEVFIPLLEESQLIRPVGLWVLEQAILQCREWLSVIPDFVMNVNVSYIQLRDMGFCRKVEELLEKYAFDVKNLTLELTESYFASEDAQINEALGNLRSLKIQLAMDDFGTGYSTLARLTTMNVDVVKIDQGFVKSLNTSQYNHDFVDAVIKLCHNLGKLVCIEGVETHEDWEGIYLLNADYIQGYYISRPREASKFFGDDPLSDYKSKRPNLSIGKEKIEKQLANDKDLLYDLMNALPLCMILWDRNGEILSCNQAALSLFGAQSTQSLIKEFGKYSPPRQPDGSDTRVLIKKNITGTFYEGHTFFKWMHRDARGADIPTEVTAVRVPYQDDFIVVSFTRDMRIERELEKENEKFRARLKALLDASPLCLNLWNKKGENILCNHEAVKLFDLSGEQEYLDRFFELSPKYQPNGRLSSEEAMRQIDIAAQTGYNRFNWMHCKLDGELIPAEITLVRIEALGDDGDDMVAGYTRDLRIQLQDEEVEHMSSRRIRAVMDSCPLACVLWSVDEKMLDCNQSTLNMFGVDDSAVLAEDFNRFLPAYQPDGNESLDKRREKIAEAHKNGRCVYEWVYLNANQEEIPCEVTMVRAVVGEQQEDVIITYSRDLRELKRTLEMNERLSVVANHDSLTGCLSRSYFMELFAQRFQADGTQCPLVFGIFDLDNFKKINDLYGHEGGDSALKAVVSQAERMLPENTLLGRFGGDEFMVVFPCQTSESAAEMIRRIVREIAQSTFSYRDKKFALSISFGAAFQTGADHAPEDLICRADAALYQAKESGRNQLVMA